MITKNINILLPLDYDELGNKNKSK